MRTNNGSCSYICPYRNSNSFCMVTACLNPAHNGSGLVMPMVNTYIVGRDGWTLKLVKEEESENEDQNDGYYGK